jgi:lipopolysaccharide assembly outer membrane protein LptD (OstA)
LSNFHSFEALKKEQTNIVHSNLYKKSTIKFFGIFFISLCMYQLNAQVNLPTDSIKAGRDSLTVDSVSLNSGTESQIKSPIKYSSKDSMMFSLKSKMIYAYGEAKLGMDEMNLEAGFIQLNMDSNFLFAKSFVDAKGVETGKPVYNQGKEKYEINTIKYNTKTKKAIITDVVTEMGGGFIHAQITKMQPNKEINLYNGKYSTCNAEHPHFYIQLYKAKVIPDKAIVSGPFNFVISDIPLPIGLPFGYFPN